MSVKAWRIVKGKHAAKAFTGEGARLAGGRWNSPGVAMVYASGSAALAMLEMLVHLQSEELLNRYVTFEISFGEALVRTLAPADLPRNWRSSPAPSSLQRIGDAWIASSASAVLRVPSAVVPAEPNYLLNPAHPDFSRIALGPKRPARFDPRLI
ncbi:MAG: RES family NAD+ phosphorylase [Planctomycetota bacterium]|nr:RES family NAD+ phosphorylase [Planctomycetota bacterium]